MLQTIGHKELNSGQAVTLRGGGSAWMYGSNCGDTADQAYANDSKSFTPTTLDQIRQDELVA